MTEEKQGRMDFKPIVGLALVSLIICGLFFPLLITGIAQAFFSYQANGEIVQLHGRDVGSNLIAQNFTLPIFFHPRNDSASSVDPDITLQEAYSQIPRISNSTGLSEEALTNLENQNVEGAVWIFGSPYVNVLRLNLKLIEQYPVIYQKFTG